MILIPMPSAVQSSQNTDEYITSRLSRELMPPLNIL